MPDPFLDLDSPPQTRAFYPSPRLRRQLQIGLLATLAAGALGVASAVADASRNGDQGFGPANVFAWAALVPLFLVLRVYLTMARDCESPGLWKSSLGLFGVLVLLNLSDLAMLDGFPKVLQIAVWVIVGIGLLELIAIPFFDFDGKENSSEESPSAQEQPANSKASRTGVIGGLVAGLVLLVTVMVKGESARCCSSGGW